MLTKGRIQAAGGGATLLEASKLPIQSFFSGKNDKTIVRISKKGVLVPNLTSFVSQHVITDKRKPVFLISASPASQETAAGGIDQVRPDEDISISNYELSSICTCSRVCFALENIWSVL